MKSIIITVAVCSFIMFSLTAAAEAKAPSDLLDAQPTTALVKEHAEAKKKAAATPTPLFERHQALRVQETKRTTTVRKLNAESLEFKTATEVLATKVVKIEPTVEKVENKGRTAARKLVDMISASGILSDDNAKATTPEVAAAE